ncbi:odorant binding protein C17 precursor [Tribolium castaneum]|uniref:Odorant binding protein C17 n=1 Tax=Tribolium castaneum TaxID=7070 RepID=D2A056_TRICA|nr:odorant binding protein C17 precursor [Tribolium castaneum]EFA02890.1 odorant binding protein C17 [Tribolium castaneum]|eukprot:NP_001137374.1 odorant binding protein C17 precursor [Tribolium castaneum]
MKSFVIFVLIIVITGQINATPSLDDFKKVQKDCQKKTGVSDESINKVNNLEPVCDDLLLQENALCILKTYEVMDEEGKICPDKLMEVLEPKFGKEKAEKLIEKCTLEKDTPQLLAHATLFCLSVQKYVV